MRIAECLELAKNILKKISSSEELSEDEVQKLEEALAITEERLNYYAEGVGQQEGLEELYEKARDLCELLLDVLEGIYLHCQPGESIEEGEGEVALPSLESLEQNLNDAFIIYHDIEEQVRLNREMLKDIPLSQA